MSNGADIEARAAAAVAHALGARAVRRDLGGKQTRDFDLVLADGSVEPLEITIAADQVVRHTWARINQLDRDAPSLTKAWTVNVPNSVLDSNGRPIPFAARDFLAEAEPLLQELETAGISELNPTTWASAGAAQPAVMKLLGLGCDLGMSHELATGEDGRIYLSSGIGGWVDPDLIAEAIEREAAKPDNQAKLSEPVGARRRHLCVLIDSSTGATFSATSHGDMGRLPVLPPPITTAWALASATAYSTTPPEPWQAHDTPEEVFTNPEKWVDSA